MSVAVWLTGHAIADTICSAVRYGLGHGTKIYYTRDLNKSIIESHDIHIGYGILRGMDKVFMAARLAKKSWFEIDKGYFKPGHYEGYYRISLNGTQQTTGLDKLEPDYERWDRLGIEIRKESVFLQEMGPKLICPPTDVVCKFFNTNPWSAIEYPEPEENTLVRHKDCGRSLQFDLDLCSSVYTFNSSVGWEALRQGMPVTSDPIHSIVGAYQKLVDKQLHLDANHRRKLFALMSSLQLTLDEIKDGKLWPLMEKLLACSSDTTAEKQLQVM